MVLSCSLRDFLSPLGMEIRLGLWKRIFYFSFLPPLLFSHVLCPEWPFRKSNLDFFFSSLTTAFFFFLLFAVTQNKDVCPVDFRSGETWKGRFSDLKKVKIMVSSYFDPSTPVSRNSTFKRRPITEHWLHSMTLKWITIGGLMDFKEKQLWLEFSLLNRLLYKSSFLHSAKFSRQSRVNYRLSLVWLGDWYARLA